MDIFWRIGAGEEYAMKFENWYEELSEEDKEEYRECSLNLRYEGRNNAAKEKRL